MRGGEASAGARHKGERERDAHKVGENVTGIRRNNLHELDGGLNTHLVLPTKFPSCSGKGRGSDGNIGMRNARVVLHRTHRRLNKERTGIEERDKN